MVLNIWRGCADHKYNDELRATLMRHHGCPDMQGWKCRKRGGYGSLQATTKAVKVEESPQVCGAGKAALGETQSLCSLPNTQHRPSQAASLLLLPAVIPARLLQLQA